MTPTTLATKIMDIVDEYGNAEHRQDDGQAVYFRNLISSEVEALTQERGSLRVLLNYEYSQKYNKAPHEPFPLAYHELCVDLAKVKAERDALAAAGKLALDALVAESRTTESNVTLAQILTAITALRQAVLA